MGWVAKETVETVLKCVEVGECCACVGLGGAICEGGGRGECREAKEAVDRSLIQL